MKTKEVVVTDKNTRETKKYQAFESVSLDIPLSAKGTPEHGAAMDKLKTLAQRVADERSSEIVVALTPVDARARKVAATSGLYKPARATPSRCPRLLMIQYRKALSASQSRPADCKQESNGYIRCVPYCAAHSRARISHAKRLRRSLFL